AYEVLRQFIDATDEMEGLLVVVSAPEALLDDFSNRSLQKYRALRNRIWDDVRDRSYPDPYAPMVRLAALQGGAA
ncbi:MAG: BREX system ATP-binding domain-containing protein, partial [Actinomycetes bacterium]